jgi:DivIVA domain-containing protein
VQLGRPGWGKKGYSTGEVDAFLGRAHEALTALALRRPPQLTADEVRSAVFRTAGFGKGRGYDEDQVDDLLDRLEQTLRATSA